MKFARKLTRAMPKYLFFVFVALMVFNVLSYFLEPGIKTTVKEGARNRNNKKIKKNKNAIAELTKRMDNERKRQNVRIKSSTDKLSGVSKLVSKKGNLVKPGDGVVVLA